MNNFEGSFPITNCYRKVIVIQFLYYYGLSFKFVQFHK